MKIFKKFILLVTSIASCFSFPLSLTSARAKANNQLLKEQRTAHSGQSIKPFIML